MDEKQKPRLLALVNLHNEFSKAYKAVERIVEKMDATTLNDIRYALRAIVDCVQNIISDQDPDKFEEAASAAELALRIAWHDVVDITFDSFRIYLDDLGKKYGPDIVAKHIDMAACAQLLTQVDELVEQSREDRSIRVQLYSQITCDQLIKLKTLFNAAKFSEGAIAKAYKKERRDNVLKYFGTFLSSIAVIIIVYVNFIKSDSSVDQVRPQMEQPANN